MYQRIIEKRDELKKALDKMSWIRYNEFIKNKLGEPACSSLIKEKEMRTKKALDKLVGLEYNEPIKSDGWFLALCLYALYNK